MPEFAVGYQPLLPGSGVSGAQLLDNIRAGYRRLAEIEDAKDEYLIGQLRDVTGLDLTGLLEAQRRDSKLGVLVGGAEALAVDTLLTSSTSGGADLPPGLDALGRPVGGAVNQTEPPSLGADDGQQSFSMLPMWNADP